MYDSLMNSPDLVTKRTELDSVSSEVAQLQLKKQNLKKTLESKITDAAILEAVYLDQVEGINLELQSKQLEQ
jgi:hypothetical protein